MAREQVEVEVVGFQSLRAQLKEANLEVQKMVALFGETSPQVAKAAERAAELKDQMDDARDAVNAFTGAGKIEAFGKAIQGVAGGFTAIQGAMGLVGVESKDLEQTLLKVQSALALTQGLAALEDVGRAFGTLKSVAVNAFNGIKAAIGSTGIGLLIVGLGAAITALVMNWEELTGALSETEKAQNEANKALVQARAGVEKQIVSVQYYQKILNDVNASEEERKFALQELQKIVPSLVDNEVNNANAIANVNKEIEIYIQNAIKRAEVDALIAKIADNNIKILEEQNKTTEESIGWFDKYVYSWLISSEEYDQTYQREMLAIDNRYEAIDKFKEQNKVFQGELDKLTGSFVKAGVEEKKYSDAGKKNTQNKEKEIDKLKERLKLVDEDLKKTQEFNKLYEQEALLAAKTEEEKLEIKHQYAMLDIQNTENAEKKKRELLKNSKTSVKEDQKELKEFKAEQEADITHNLEIEEIKRRLLVATTDAERKRLQEELATKTKELEEKRTKDFEAARKAEFETNKGYLEEYFKQRQIDLNAETLTDEERTKRQKELEDEKFKAFLVLHNDYNESSSDLILDKQDRDKKARDKEIQDEKKKNQEIADFAFSSAAGLTDALQKLSQARMSAELADAEGNAQKQEEIKRKYFEKDKQFQYAKTVIAGAQAGMQAFAQGMEIGGPPLAAIFLALSVAQSLIQLGAIASTQYVPSTGAASGTSTGSGGRGAGSQYEQGGLLVGPSHDLGGIRTSLGELEGGEFVMNRRSTANFLPLLQKLNDMGNIAGPEIRMATGTPLVKAYVLASDVTSAQEANARLKTLARL